MNRAATRTTLNLTAAAEETPEILATVLDQLDLQGVYNITPLSAGLAEHCDSLVTQACREYGAARAVAIIDSLL